MRRTYRKNILRTVRASLSRFLAIFAIVALGVGFLSGLLASPVDMRLSADDYCRALNLYDIKIQATQGLTEGDLNAVRSTEGVGAVMPAYDMDLMLKSQTGKTLTTRLMSIPGDGVEEEDKLNDLVLVDGRMPSAPDEIVVGLTKDFSGDRPQVGDILTVSADNEESISDALPDSFTVVGTVRSAAYFSVETEYTNVGTGTIALFAYANDSAFEMDYYTTFYIAVDGARELNSFSSAYEEKVGQVYARLDAIKDERAKLRYDEIVGEAQAQLDDARAEYEKGKAEAEAELADAAQELETGRAELADAEAQLASAKKEIDDGQAQLDAGRAQLNAQLPGYRQQIADGYAQIESAQAQIDENQALLDEAKAPLAALKQGKDQFWNVAVPQLSAAFPSLGTALANIEGAAEQTDSATIQAIDLITQFVEAIPPSGSGQGGTDPGQGGTDPGQGGTDPGQGGTDPGQGGIDPGQGGIDPGQGGIDPGQGGIDPGQGGIDPGQGGIDPGQGGIDPGQGGIDPGQGGIDPGQGGIDPGQGGIDPGQGGIDPGQGGIDPGQGGIDQGLLDEYLQQFQKIKSGLEALAAQEPPTTLDEALAQLDTQQAALDAGQAKLTQELANLQASEQQLNQTVASAQASFDAAEAKLADARQQYTDGMVELENGRRELADGEQAYEEGKAEAQAELDDAWEQILDAESDVREIEQGKWILGDRDDNVSFSSYDSNAQRIANIATVFPVFFFLVAALVALTTMTRMVEEERLQIGTMKALGYSRGKIAAKYLLYALAASLAGSAVGMVIGMQLFPSIILNAYNIMYDLPVLKTPFNTLFGAIATGTAVACTLLATLNACWAELREQPASLMLPKAPKAGKRILLEHIRPVWRRMRFTHKVTARNLFLYKKRFFMTVVGIAGCTALLVTGFGVRDSISDIVEKQFDDLAHYQLMVSIQDESATQGKELQALLNDTSRITGYLPVAQQDVTVVPEGDTAADNLYITVPTDTVAMNDYFTFRHRNGGGSIELGEGSVIITEKLAERQGLKAGDIITVEDADGNTASFTITDVCENYISHYLYMSVGVYEAAFGKAPETNLLLCQLADGMDEDPQAEEALATELLQCRDVAGAQFTHELTASFSQSLGSINYIVVVLIIAAGALAFVVLYNLTNINISERAKELATIKVLGFYDSEVGAYIYRETSLLTLIGTACGLAFGVALHTFVIRTAEVDMVMFGRSIYPLSFVWSALLTILFSLLVNAVMYRKLKAISMVESMKAPE